MAKRVTRRKPIPGGSAAASMPQTVTRLAISSRPRNSELLSKWATTNLIPGYCRRATSCITMPAMFQKLTQVFVLLFSLASVYAVAQETGRESLVGSWEGPLVLGRDNMNMAFTFSLTENVYSATMTSGEMGIFGMPVTSVSVEDRSILLRIPRLDLEFTGTIRRDESGQKILRIDGDWFQYSEMVPIVLRPVEAPTF